MTNPRFGIFWYVFLQVLWLIHNFNFILVYSGITPPSICGNNIGEHSTYALCHYIFKKVHFMSFYLGTTQNDGLWEKWILILIMARRKMDQWFCNDFFGSWDSLPPYKTYKDLRGAQTFPTIIRPFFGKTFNLMNAIWYTILKIIQCLNLFQCMLMPLRCVII